MNPTRIVVWGLGRHALKNILPAVSAASGIELYGVCSRNPDHVADCSARWKCRGWTEPTLMLDDPNVDVVYVATPIGLHAEHGKRVLESHKHLWCEKPFTSRLQDTRDLVEIATRRRLLICEGHMYLYHPQFRRLSAYVHDERIGPIVSIGCRFGIPRLDHAGFRSDPTLGGGALFDVGCYPISAVQALFPEQTLKIRYARVVSGRVPSLDIDGEALISLSSGVIARLEWRRNTAYRNEIDIWGENGSLFTDKIFSKPPTYVPVFRFRNSHGVETTETGESADHFVLMLQAFGGMLDDDAAMEAERDRITRRAEVIEEIWSDWQAS